MIRAIQFQNKRVGSTFLQKAIDSHPDIIGIDEVFVNMARKKGMRKSGFVPFLRSDINDAGEYIRKTIYKTYPNKHTIFKLMYNQIDYHAGLFQFIKENKIPIIHLMRKNLVKQVLSGMNAATTKHEPIVVTPKELMKSVIEADKQNKMWAKRLKDHIKLTLYYENIIGDKGDTITTVDRLVNMDICRGFFDVTYLPMYATTKKKNKEDISVYLPNIKEIRDYFNNSKNCQGGQYLWMLM